MRQSRHIAFISEHASPLALIGGQDAGGQNVYVDALARQLAGRGYTVDIFTRRDSVVSREVVRWASGVRVIHVDAGPPEFVPKDELWEHMPAFRDAMLAFVRRTGSHYDLIHGHYWMSGWVACEVGERLGVPVVQLFHATGVTKRMYQGADDTSPRGRIAVEREVVARADAVVAQCPAEERELIEAYGAAPQQLALIPAGVNTDVFRPEPHAEARRASGVGGDGPVVVYVGRILPRKDVRNVVRALAVLARRAPEVPVRLLVVGGETIDPDPEATPELGALDALARELGVRERMSLVGMRQPEALRSYYCAGDVVVTTPWYEPFGLTPLEAMACGRPVIGSTVGGLTYSILDGRTGYLVPPRDPEALATRLLDVLTDRVRAERMGAAALARARDEFTWERVAERTSRLYERVLRGWRVRALSGFDVSPAAFPLELDGEPVSR